MDRQKEALIKMAQEIADMAHGDLSNHDQNVETLQALIHTAREILGYNED